MNASTFSPKSSSWFKTKVLSLLSLFLFSFILVGCGSSSGGGGKSSDKNMTGFTFNNNVLKKAVFNGTNVDITIDDNFGNQAPSVTYTGVSYSPTGTIDFKHIPVNYQITAEDGSTKDYLVTIRRAFFASDEGDLKYAIGQIDDAIRRGESYFTILVTNDIELLDNATTQTVIPSTWEGKNIILENNSTSSNVTIKGLAIEKDKVVTLDGVNVDIALQIVGFTFSGGVVEPAEIVQSNNSIDITIDYNSTFTTPQVNHTGVSYSPNNTVAIDFASLPANYTVTAANNLTKSYQVIVRRAIKVSREGELISAIGTIDDAIANNESYITILIDKDINLTGANQRNINSTWKGKNIIIKNNSNLADINITGLTVDNDTVEFIGVRRAPASNSKELKSFTFPYNVTKNATISGTDVDITIDYDSNYKTPLVTHTGFDYSPSEEIDFANIPANYKITANDNSNKTYSVIVRRAITVSNETALSYAIDTINNAIANNESYITILITKDINLTGANQRNITSAWKGKNIILEKNSTASVVTVGGLIVEGSGAVALKDVNIVNITIVAGYYNSFALRSDGKLWASGYNDFGQLGLGNNVSKTSFESVTISGLPSGAKIVSIAAGGFHSLALDSEGGVWASGYNDFGQLGLSNNVSKTSFVKVTSLSDKNITAITAGYYHSLALDNNGKVWASGYDNDGQLGLGDTNGKNVFTEVSLSGKIITAIAAGAGGHHSLALDSNGGVWASGYNEAGQLGLRDTNKRTSFEQVTINTLPSNAKIVSIAVNHVHSLALDSNGGVWASGLHDRGQLGLGNDINQNEFKSVIINGLTSGAKIVSISAGGIHSLALDDDGKLWATGDNTYGQLALGNNVSKASFQSVAISAKIVSVSGGAFYSLALTNDGVLLGAGHNGAGELGLGGVFRTTVFTPISF